MKYMLMMNTPRGGDYQVMSWPKQDLAAHIAFMIGFAKKLGAAGELVGAEGGWGRSVPSHVSFAIDSNAAVN